MRSFSYNPKTQVFEYRLRDTLHELHVKGLLAIHERRYLDHDGIETLFADDLDVEAHWQVKHDIFYHLSNLGLILFKNDKKISDWDGKKYVNERTVSGYFLTEMGKSLVNSLLPKDQRNKFRHND